MESISDIMNRDHRTAVSVSMRSRSAVEASDSCDKCQNQRQTKHFAKSPQSVVKRSKSNGIDSGIPDCTQSSFG